MISRMLFRNLAILLALVPLSSSALDLIVNGFGTVCASKSDLAKSTTVYSPLYSPFVTTGGTPSKPLRVASFVRPTYVGAERRWNFLPNSKFALQFTSIFDDRFKAVVQVVGRWETMTEDHYKANFDWAYLQYNRNNNLDVQFGRFRIPAFYYSDSLDVNNAQPWVMPPDEVYFIVGGAFRNMDGIKARYSYYLNNWTANGQFWLGSMQEQLFILFEDVTLKARDVFGLAGQLNNDFITLRASVMRAIYDTNLYSSLSSPIPTLTSAVNNSQAKALAAISSDKNQNITYVGLAAALNITDKLDFLAERASILSPGIISTSRVGWYGSLSYSFLEKFALTGTYGFSRPLNTDVNKYDLVRSFVNSSGYLTLVDSSSGAGNALAEGYKSYLGKQRSYALDLRYDILPALALKGSVKYVKPVQCSNYILNRQLVSGPIWVYRVSMDFVF